MNIVIKPSSELRKNYNSIADICRSTGNPVFLTRNGTGDTVIMDVDTFNKREEDLKIAQILLSAEKSRVQGVKGYTAADFEKNMRTAIKKGISNGKR